MHRLLCFATAASAASLADMNLRPGDEVVALFKDQDPQKEEAFLKIYDQLMEQFDIDAHHHLLAQMAEGLESYRESKAFNAYRTVPSQAHCDPGTAAPDMSVKAVAAFPGGVTRRQFGFDISKFVADLASKAKGPAAGSSQFPMMLAMQGLTMGLGLLQTGINVVLQVVPPLIPPPMWNNQPLTCLPMITGHNCFGAVMYPITAADFITADMTDRQLDGVIAGFPSLYKNKVGKTSDTAYRMCFSAYMSMQCGSIFPRCAVPQARNEPAPVGRLPMCFTHCIATLVLCPGFWIEDIIGECMMVSAPPQCAMAVYHNMWRLPPQYSSFEESNPTPMACPKTPRALGGDAGMDFDLYSEGQLAKSPFEAASAKVPDA